MDNGTFVTAGLVLRETETKESDKILTVLTPELGRISVIAKGQGAGAANIPPPASCWPMTR